MAGVPISKLESVRRRPFFGTVILLALSVWKSGDAVSLFSKI